MDSGSSVGVNGSLYSAQGEDNVLSLAQGWHEAEFNIFGDCCLDQAVFNSGSTIVVRTSVDDGTTNAPTCVNQSFTGETNSLDLVNPCSANRRDVAGDRVHGEQPRCRVRR